MPIATRWCSFERPAQRGTAQLPNVRIASVSSAR
jgi:hypothetical protein